MKTSVAFVWMVLVLASSGAAASEADSIARLREAVVSEPLRLQAPRVLVVPPTVQKEEEAILTKVLTLPIRFHRSFISPQDGDRCTFTPSCSEYALEAIRHDPLFGWVRISDRLLRDHPGNESDYPLLHGRKYDPERAESASRLRPSRAALGAFLSLVPGLGQTVGGSPSDGVQALMTVGLFGAGAYLYRRRGEETKAILTGALAGFFYIGNLYGGARAIGSPRSKPD